MPGAKLYPTREAAQADADTMLGWPTPAVLPQCEYDGADHEPYHRTRCWAGGMYDCDGYIIRVYQGRSDGPHSWTLSEYVLENERVGSPG